MAKKVYEEEKIRAIANKIREKTGGEESYTTDAMPDGIDKAYKAGQKAEYDKFWDVFQDYGKRPYYTYAFAYTWTDDIYNPKYPITSEAMIYIMYLSSITDTKVDIISDDLSYAFNQAKKLKTIRKLIVKETTKYTSAFYGCTELENIAFEGVIGQDIDFKNCSKLTRGSLMSAINALKSLGEVKETVVDYDGYSISAPPDEVPFFSYNKWYEIIRTDNDYHEVRFIGDDAAEYGVTINMEISPVDENTKAFIVYSANHYALKKIVVETSETKTLTLHADAKARLTADDVADIARKGWTLA